MRMARPLFVIFCGLAVGSIPLLALANHTPYQTQRDDPPAEPTRPTEFPEIQPKEPGRAAGAWGMLLLVSEHLRAGGRSGADAQDPPASGDPREVIRKAIEAMGGQDKLTKWKARYLKAEGTWHRDGEDVPVTMEMYFEPPDRYRFKYPAAADSAQKFVVVIRGDRGWGWPQGARQRAVELDQQQMAEFRQWIHRNRIVNLVPLLEEEFELSRFGPVEVAGEPAVGIKVEHPEFNDVKLFFDQDSWLLAKTVTRVSTDGGSVVREQFLRDYETVRGVKFPTQIKILRGEEDSADFTIQKRKLQKDLPDRLFQIPEESSAPSQKKDRSSETEDTAAVQEPEALNALWIGCSQEGAINYLLENGGRKMQLLSGHLSPVVNLSPLGYDAIRIIKLPEATTGKICLYFRRGHLFRKCIVPGDDESDPDEIFRREIASGLQHPPNYPGLLDKVHWGPAAKPKTMPLEGEDEVESQSLPRVRCGIALEGLSPHATEQGYNVVVLYQNVGEVPIDEEILLPGFPLGPVVSVTSTEQVSGETVEYTLDLRPIGLYGTEPSPFPFRPEAFDRGGSQSASPAKDETTSDAEESPENGPLIRMAPFRLDPGETAFMYFSVPKLESLPVIRAEVFAFFAARPNVMVMLDIQSEKVDLNKNGSDQ